MSWFDEAKLLKQGDSKYIMHEGCTTQNKMWIYHSDSGYGCYCNKCGYKYFKSKGIRKLNDIVDIKHSLSEELVEYTKVELPEDIEYNIELFPTEAKLWLYSSDIRNYQIEKYGIGYSKSLSRVIIPVYNENSELIMWQGRGLYPTQTKYFNVRGTSKKDAFFKSWVSEKKIHKFNYNKIIVVEDALSVIKVGRTCHAVASLGTSLSMSQYLYLANWKEVVFWYDDDKGGWDGSNKGIKRLSMLTNCYRVRTQEDPKRLSYTEIEEILSVD